MTSPAPVQLSYRRPHLLLTPAQQLLCPQPVSGGRHLLEVNGATFLPSGLIKCNHQLNASRGKCGARVFILQMPGGWRYVALVTAEEIKQLEQSQMSAEATLAYLLGASSSLPTASPPDGIPPQ